MIEHFQNDDFERYVSSEISAEYLQWFEEAQAHLEKCEGCRKKLQSKMVFDLLFDDTNMLPAGIQMLKAVKADGMKPHNIPVFIKNSGFGPKDDKSVDTNWGINRAANVVMPPAANRGVSPAANVGIPPAASVHTAASTGPSSKPFGNDDVKAPELESADTQKQDIGNKDTKKNKRKSLFDFFKKK